MDNDDKLQISRRAFLTSTLLSAAAGASRDASAQSQPPKAPSRVKIVAGAPIAKTLLQASDFEFLGGFILPQLTAGLDVRFGRGLTHRYVGADLRFLSTAHKSTASPRGRRDGELFEVGFPGISVTPPYPVAPILRHWGDIYQDKMCVGTSPTNQRILREKPRGLWWDEAGQRLYWAYSSGGGDDGYSALTESATLGASVLDQTSGTGQALACWRLTPAPYKTVMRGCVPIPDWFANAHCAGRRIAVGFGGYFSVMTAGSVSMGPSLWAIDPPASEHRSTVPAQPLVSYHPPHTDAYRRPLRCTRNTDYRTEFDRWAPRDGVGYWTWADEIHQGCVWIDLPDRHAILFFPSLGHGRLWYQRSDRHAERAFHWWFAYNPFDLARVARNPGERDLVVPAWTQQVNYPRLNYPVSANPSWFTTMPRVVGSTFDSVTRTLFLMILTKTWPASEQTVFAYRIK